ncbi:hypothetical protein GCM10010211_83510 [Streptomyces albospinus]|uniref:Integral membrane protein n=1 Tax=Streptomyces albospinus TaxID=285515 RepID=A0ABQ2VNW2_9ACTN|nr:hypothetical protein [Streptomyces albospinus]GGV03576.1 hypothetical protein GCM10010211_83510 [Streptomyces albospinus]
MPDTVSPPAPRYLADRYACWAGLAVGAIAAPLWATTDISRFGNDYGFDVPLVSAVMAFGLCAVGGVLLGDALTPRPQEAVRTAGLTPRRVRDLVPPRLTVLLPLEAVLLVLLVGIGAAKASPDAIHRAVAVATQNVACDGVPKAPVSLWPGMFYGNQILVSLAIGTAACAWALRRIAHRPGDDQQRRNRSRAVTAGWGVLAAGQLLAVLLMIASFLTNTSCEGTPGTLTAVVIYPMSLLALVTLAWSLFTLVAPRAVRQ